MSPTPRHPHAALLKVEKKEFSNVDYIDMIETQAKFRGYQCGVKYAEAYKGVKAWPRGITKSLLPQYL